MQETYFTDLLRKPVWMFFLFSWLFYLTGLFLFSQFVWDSNTYMLDFRGTHFNEYISNIRKMDHIRYALSPLWILGIATVIWLVIKSGLVFLRIDFSKALLFKIILLGLFFISLSFWVRSIWLILFRGSYVPDDIKYFYPGSIVPFLDISEMMEIMISTLANINIYHIGFMLFTSWQISVHSSLNYFRSFMLLLFTYGISVVLLRFIILVIIL